MIEYERNPNTKCIACKKDIYKRPAQIKSSRVFCSQTCYGKSCRKEVACIICGTLILGGLNKKTCSRSCSNKNRVGIKYGMMRPNDKIKKQEIIKSRLIETRGMKCEVCGYSKYNILHIHHKDRNRQNNSFDNLELICPNCHYEKHYLERHLKTK